VIPAFLDNIREKLTNGHSTLLSASRRGAPERLFQTKTGPVPGNFDVANGSSHISMPFSV
jgi:hypothetical protein